MWLSCSTCRWIWFKGGAHWYFALRPGARGSVLIEDALGNPVTIAGVLGKGRIAVSGCYYGDENRLTGVESVVVFSMLDWPSLAATATRSGLGDQ